MSGRHAARRRRHRAPRDWSPLLPRIVETWAILVIALAFSVCLGALAYTLITEGWPG